MDDAGDGEVAGLGRKVEVAARVDFAVDGAGEGPHVVIGLAGFGRDADIDGLEQQVGLQLGAEENAIIGDAALTNCHTWVLGGRPVCASSNNFKIKTIRFVSS